MQCKKGIILAGGAGSRLYPLTLASNKQLLPIYDKPTIYYPLTTLMLAGIREILLISTPRDLPVLQKLLGSGEDWGMRFEYLMQESPRGLPDAFIIGEKFIGEDTVGLILGDNFFHGHGLSEAVYQAADSVSGAHVFLYGVEDPSRYGVMILDKKEYPVEIVEKPKTFLSNFAVTGLYFFDATVTQRAKSLQPSARGELEITDLIRSYMAEGKLTTTRLGRGYVWFDVGTPESLLSASQYVEIIQSRQGITIASPEEIAWRMEFISSKQLERLIASCPQSTYRHTLEKILKDNGNTQNSA